MRRFAFRLAPLAALACLSAVTGSPVKADTVLYSNIGNFSGFGYSAGLAAVDSSGGSNTVLQADDLTPIAGSAGAAIDSITFSVVNFATTAITANVDIRIYASNPGVTTPTTLLAALNFNPISFAGNGATALFTYAPGSTIFTLPVGSTIWAGEFFTNDGIPGTTQAQLTSLGDGIFAPPTVGTSNDYFFQATAPDPNEYVTSNPAGGLLFFGGNPTADFGWAFSGTPLVSSVPEPSPMVLAGGLGAIFAAVSAYRRRVARNKTVAA